MDDVSDATARVADLIWAAWRSGERVQGVPDAIRPGDDAAGWAAQRRLAELAGPSYGWKIAATSSAGQAHIGVSAPLAGPLFERFRYESGATLPSDGLHMRVVEAEFAFLMGRDLPSGASGPELVDAVSAMHLAVEVPDSRFDRFETVGAPSLLADAACAGMFVLGPAVDGWRAADLAAAPTALTVNGTLAAAGRGAAVLGSPLAALEWVAGDLARRGHGLRAGELVTTGTTTVPPAIGPGDRVRAGFAGFGEVELTFAR
jgi:2-keto-4-pentenoate hydratase